MYATSEDVAAHLGRPLTAAEKAQVNLWVEWLSSDIDQRVTNPDPATAQRVVVESVVAYLRNPDNATTVDVSVDDARVSRRYSTSTGRVEILPHLWELLGWFETGAFTVTPFGAPDPGVLQ